MPKYQLDDTSEARLRRVVMNASPNLGNSFPHFFGDFFVLVRKSKITLHKGQTSKNASANKVFEGPRNGETYAKVASIIEVEV